jgi:metal-responsive CopG/Arc/MetJ family transcriptional regulator
MSTVNFSIPEDVKDAFNATFEGQNKSAVIADLMREAVERAQSQQRGKDAFQRILARRQYAPSVTETQFRIARDEGRP